MHTQTEKEIETVSPRDTRREREREREATLTFVWQ